MESHQPDIMELIAHAPWREAVTYRETWPHEYVVIQKDVQQKLLTEFCRRVLRGESVEGRFFHQSRQYRILGDYKYLVRLDILARDRKSGRQVAIENQLYQSDHTHLGQLITYAAGRHSQVLIWIAPNFSNRRRDRLA